MESENPFKGASSYEDGDSFYGRENEVKELTSLVRNESLTLLFSRSGTGKSSLLKAGLFPALKGQSEFFPVYIHLNDAAVKQTSDSNLCGYVIKICTREINNYFKDKENYTITLPVNIRPDSLFEFIHNIKIVEAEPTTSSEYVIKPVLIFDQLEEIFTSPFNKSELQFLAKEIKCLIENEIPDYLKNEVAVNESNDYQKLKNTLKSKQKNFRVVFSFREEYLPQFESLRKEIPAIRFTNGRYRLEPFTIDTAQNIIIKTAPLIKEEIATIVAENIAIEIEGFDEKRVDPFLLSLICQIIYGGLLVNNDLSPEDTNARIKLLVENALESYVTKVYSEISEETKKFIEDKLITTDGKKNSVNYNEVENNSDLKSDILKLVNNPQLRLLSIGQFLDSKHITILHDRLLPPLIQRKNERKINEENKAFIIKRQELEKANRRKTIAVLLYFLIGTVCLIAFLSYTLVEKNKVVKATDAYRKAYKEAEDAKAYADLSEKKSTAIKIKADSAIVIAKQSQQKALRLTMQAKYAKHSADIAKQAYQSQKELTALLQKSIDTNNVQKDLLKNNITNFALNDDQDLQDEIFDSLFALKNNHAPEYQYKQLLKSITSAINSKRQVLNDSLEGFFNAKELWQKNKKNEIVEKIIYSFINEPVYYKQVTSLSGESNFDNKGKTFLSFSNLQNQIGSTDFSFNYHDKIYAGHYNADQDTMIIHSGVNYSIVDVDSVSKDNINKNTDTVIFKSLVNHHDTITGLVNNCLFIYAPREKTPSHKFTLPVGNYSDAVLSYDAKHLITYSNFDSVILWNISRPDNVKKTVLKVKSNGIRSIIFSKNSDKFLILELTGAVSIFKVDVMKSTDTTLIANSINNLYIYDRIRAANFSTDDTNLIAVGVSTLYIRNLNISDTLHPIYRLPYPYYSSIKSIIISSDNKKIIIETPLNIIIGGNIDGSSLLKGTTHPTPRLLCKKFYSNDTSRAIAFLSSNSIMNVNNKGNVFLLKTYPKFKTLNEAFTTIEQSPFSLIERLKSDPSNSALFTQLLDSNDVNALRSAAKFYSTNSSLEYNKPDFSKSIQLYEQLLTKGINTNNKAQDALSLINILEQASFADTSTTNKTTYYKKITSISEKYEDIYGQINTLKRLSGIDTSLTNKVSNYKKIIAIANNNKDIESQNSLSIDYGNLAFYSFFLRDFEDGLMYALKGYELDTVNNFIITNIALGYLFTNQFENAEKYYTQYKNERINNDGRTFKVGFKQDLEDLEAYGIVSKKNELMYNEVEHIRNNILN